MRKIILTAALTSAALSVGAQEHAQQLLTLGAGYLGETLVHPGFVLQSEFQCPISKKWSIPMRVEAGYYLHQRYHQAALLQAVSGLRFHPSSRLYLGANLGAGGMLSWHHSDDGIYEVDDAGNVSSVSSFAGTDFLLSTGIELGYQVSKKRNHFIWVRPSYKWQMQVNQKALGHLTLEIGYSFTLNKSQQ